MHAVNESGGAGLGRAVDRRATALFATADNKYVPPSVMALRSFQRWFPECAYFLLATRTAMSERSLALLQRYRIELIDLDEACRFRRPERYKNANPPECFYMFKGPELLAERGYRYSISVDGDVYCPRHFDLPALCGRIEGFGGRPVGTLSRTLRNKQREQLDDFDFAYERVRDVLGIDEELAAMRYEINSGVVVWNNIAMAQCGLFEKAARVFVDCRGGFRGDQELLAFTAAAHRIPFTQLDDSYNFCFFEDSLSPGPDAALRKQIRRGMYQLIRIVHFVFSKPWRVPVTPSAAKAHFINEWRRFVLGELGDEASILFGDLSMVRARYPNTPFWNLLRAIRAWLGR